MEKGKSITKAQLGYIHKLLADSGQMDAKAELVFVYSNARTSSSRELTFEEGKAMIEGLLKASGKPKEQTSEERMRRKILSMAHEMKWEKAGGKVDIDRVNAWCEKYGAEHQPLNTYPDNALAKLVTVFEKMYLGYLKGFKE